ncbi:Na+/H+ antiporter subunit E [Agromyces bracchium]|uniref:Na+/H+ antiporter subunit E n=1 Tax=Agromyces bracchium TaxID=88376 RepID=A0A6I3M4C2_9MICO|nr:Na+/H+ antiporter subunit E [Agromyces bracchium]MTH67731.1 Na+/H+ antiporter subunit E [Agromyces bracchium]
MTDAASDPATTAAGTGASPAPPAPPRPTRPEDLTRWQAVWRQLPLLIGLVALWIFLWDHVDVLTVTTGVILAIAVTRMLYLPPVLLSGRFNPWRGLLLGLRMMFDVTVASVQVAARAIWPGWTPMNAIIAVQLLTRSDLVTTLTAEAITVVPGTVVVDIDRERGLLYLHALGTRTTADLERVRREVLGTEERIVLAIGTHEQAEAVRAARRHRRATGRKLDATRPEPEEIAEREDDA